MFQRELLDNKWIVQPKRVVNYKAQISYDNNLYHALICNLSETSLYVIMFPSINSSELMPGETAQVTFEPPFNGVISLQCRIKWSYKTPPHGLTLSIGMEIVAPQPDYKNLLFNQA